MIYYNVCYDVLKFVTDFVTTKTMKYIDLHNNLLRTLLRHKEYIYYCIIVL